MRKFTIVMILMLGALTQAALVDNVQAQSKKKIDSLACKDAIQQDLNQKTKAIGTFDLYDDATRRVFNLRLISMEEPSEKAGKIAVPVKFRDTASGDAVTVEAYLKEKDGKLRVDEWKIAGVEVVQDKTPRKDNYTDEEVRQAIQDYVKKQTEFTVNLLFYDPVKDDMRKLQLVSLDNVVRHFGILSIVSATFKDVGSNETIVMDIRVKVKKGLLDVDTMKIQKVNKPQ